MEDTQNKINNNSLADLHHQNDSMASIHNKIPDRDDSHSISPPEEDDGDAKSHDSDIDSQQVPSQHEADNSCTSDDERYDPIGQLVNLLFRGICMQLTIGRMMEAKPLMILQMRPILFKLRIYTEIQ
jgi:hypothetical protein